MKQYDAIVIGGGINSLAAATMLAQEEKTVLLLESRETLGGMASSYEFTPRFRCNMIYDYIPWIDPRLIKKLNLEEYGFKLSTPDPFRVALDENGNHIIFHNDPAKTAASIASHCAADGKKWIEFTKYIRKLTSFLKPLYKITPPAISELNVSDAFKMSAMLRPIWKHGTRGLVDTIRSVPMMMPELLDEWFESKLLRGSLAGRGITHINQGPYSAATSLNFLHQHIHAGGQIHGVNYINGGTDKFTYALYKAARKMGVDIRIGTSVSSINCKSGICSGVSISDGKTYNSDMVISGLDPNHTFIKLVGSSKISPTFQRQLKNIKYRGSTARIHFALKKCPEITGIDKGQLDTIFSINPSMEYLERAYDDVKYGRISEKPCIEFNIPTLRVPDYAPKGKHVLSATLQYAPYNLRRGNWNDKFKKHLIQNVRNILTKYIPDFPGIIEKSVIMTPVDLESSLGLTEGNLSHGEMTLDQFFFMRPTITTAQYKTPIQNLFLCGPGTHPGGGLHGANAVNATNEIL